MLKGGLLGLGTIGKVHKSAYDRIMSERDDVKVEAYFDLCPENFEGIENARTYTDLDEFFEKEAANLDFVDICLPTFMHKDVSIKAMNAGLNVICEKPMALNYEDAQQMCKVAEETGKTLMVAHCVRFRLELKKLKEYIDKEPLGKLVSVRYATCGRGLPNGQNNWFKNKALSGGPIFDVSVHDVDNIQFLVGMPESLSAIATPTGGESAYTAIAVNYQYKNGICVNLQSDWALPASKHNNGKTIRLNFENGYVIYDAEKFVQVDAEGNIENVEIKDDRNISRANIYDEITYFINCVKTGSRPEFCLPEDSAANIKIICSEIDSAEKKGERVIL